MNKLQTISALAYEKANKYRIGKTGMITGIVNSIIAGAIGLLVLAGVMVGVTAFGTSQTAGSAARNLTDNIGKLSQNFGNQLPTVGTMFGVSLILGAIGLLGLGIALGARKMQ